MRRLILFFVVVLAATSLAFAQVIADFESTLGGFGIGPASDFGTALTKVTRVTDPTSVSTGVMKLNFSYPGTGFSKGAVLLKPAGGLAVHGAAFITYWIYVPDSIPAGFTVNVFAQDNVHYAWHVVVLKGSDIPAHTWYPLSINLAQLEVTDTTFNLTTGNVFQTGIQFDTGTDTTVAWNDSVYVDNVALVGSTPTVVANFETTLNGFLNLGNGPALTALKQAPDPTSKSSGVMKTYWNFPADSARVGAFVLRQAGGLPINGARFITYWVYLPDTTPDSLIFGVYAQDNVNYQWREFQTIARDIPKNKWYPLSLDLAQEQIKDPSFNLATGNIFQTGIQVQNVGVANWPSWTDSVYVDNVSLIPLSAAPAVKKFVITNFTTHGDVGGFYKESWGPAALTLANGVDTTNAANRVLIAGMSFSDTGSVAVVKGAIARDNVGIYSASNATNATEIDIDVFVPFGFPDSAHFGAAYQGPATGGAFTSDDYQLLGSSGSVMAGQWNTLKYNVTAHLADHSITNVHGNGTFIAQVYFNGAKNWAGELFFDNLTLIGIDAVTGVAASTTSPFEYRLYSNYPNPFNPATTIRYDLKQQGKVSLKVYNLLGQEVAALVDGQQAAGQHSVVFDASRLSSGAYFVQIRAGSFNKSMKILLLK